MKTGRSVFALLLAAALLSPPAPASGKLDPARRWRTAETEHFVLHFHEDAGETAARAARIAEEAHARLVPRIRWSPRAKTRLILADERPAQGWATPYPYNQILVSLAPPSGEPGFGATLHDDWLRLVITHEYAHVLQLDMASRFPRVLRSVFGRLYFPNALQPRWLIEGLATYEETELTPGGRGRSPGAAMVLRMAALEGRIPRLDEMAVGPDRWPAGQVPYLFGESFLRRLVERFGRDRVAALSTTYAGRTLPYFVESTAVRVLGEGYGELWREWADGLRARSRAEEQAAAARGITPSTPLTASGFLTVAPAWSPGGDRIAWLQADEHEYPALWVMSADGSGKRRLARNAFAAAGAAATLAWSPDGGRIYYAKPGILRGVAVVDDLWAFDLRADREVRISRGLGARDPHPSPDGERLLFVQASRGMTRLAVLESARKRAVAAEADAHPLTPWSRDQLAGPRWSPDGSRIAVSVWRPGGDQDIWILDSRGAKLAEITRDRALDAAPAWSRDGRLLFFSSDRSGIFNLFAWDPATGDLRQVSNVVGGAFSPSPSPDGRAMAFADYSARGFDIRVMGTDPASWRPVEPWRDPFPPAEPSEVAGVPASVPYSPLATILPRLWAPWFAATAESGALAGFITGGQDVLQRHRYLLTGLYGPSSGRLSYTADYVYDGLRPSIRLRAADVDRTFVDLVDDEGVPADYTERERSLGFDVIQQYPGFASSHALTIGYRHRRLDALSDLPPGLEGSATPAEGRLGSVRLAWAYGDAYRRAASISPEGGRRIEIGMERFSKATGSDLTFTRMTADWTEYLRLPPRHHVLQGRLFLGRATGESPAQGAFRLGGDSPGEIAYAVGDQEIHLRGYPLNAFRGVNAVLAGVEYRFPLHAVGRGGGSAPFFLRNLHGALFLEAGDAWDPGVRSASLKSSVGAEVRLDLYFSYFVPLTLRLGLAWGMGEEGGVYPLLGIWMPQEFLSGF